MDRYGYDVVLSHITNRRKLLLRTLNSKYDADADDDVNDDNDEEVEMKVLKEKNETNKQYRNDEVYLSLAASKLYCTALENARFGFTVFVCWRGTASFGIFFPILSKLSCRIISFVRLYLYGTQYISPILEATAVRLTFRRNVICKNTTIVCVCVCQHTRTCDYK